jgi:hypothetical protein
MSPGLITFRLGLIKILSYKDLYGGNLMNIDVQEIYQTADFFPSPQFPPNHTHHMKQQSINQLTTITY